MELFIVQQRNIPISGDVCPMPNEWENKKAFSTMAKAYKHIHFLDPTAKKKYPTLPNNHQYIGGLRLEWKIDVIELDNEERI